MINQIYVEMLVNKILTKEINPNTGDLFKIEDIKIAEYKTAVEAKLSATQ
ncbi:hypothetical protein HMT_42 [Clostridium phage HM T]|uniref:Uncharacterized protein n=1 Tax=Clostridium saccharoperbutylacetonicum N1-4(HMT) TaxID=931276 RepID=M1MIZ4_9CLOT|nr:hypothetical protein [Clostridium saccharoperbutylacetonicum]AMB17454.1 hypothetical protein HMT_42 [Clostridium phage HM T]AGF54806.1 hypothetical protein Cspa_c10300 [Clostridium saccharoperbutylacetonicum N1-4(HMT)]NRT58673.1 hypothetical protein [Clostridium saccharoperbutylacetonicum]NRT64489.1 hypothetical protein [Clostridium saccharoperbutylacetonicum]NSB27862.1 hypothetical protein [Clostridium saccharoperbutylacetonicum]